jgi:golgi SNAP receptor complex member 2
MNYDLYCRRVAQLSGDCAHIRLAYEKHIRKANARIQEQEARAQLFAGGVRPNARGIDQALVRTNESLTHSSQEVDNMTMLANSVMSNLHQQREHLKNAHRKALDIFNTLGLSRSILQMIERRTSGDKILVYGGMFVVTLLIIVLYYYFRM